MPQVGEVKTGNSLGYKDNRAKFIFSACIDCGEGRWVRLKRNLPISPRCKKCSVKESWATGRTPNFPRGNKHYNWKGGQIRAGAGYITELVQPDDFFYSMADKRGYILQHRLVLARSLGRCLQSWEVVHHKNHKRDDNRIENLELCTDMSHKLLTHLETQLKKLQSENELLHLENNQLRGKLHC